MKIFKGVLFLLLLTAMVFVWGIVRYPLATAKLLPFLPSIERLPLTTATPKTVDKSKSELLMSKDSYVGLKEIPLPMRQAVVAIEDRRFYQHSGVDLYGIGRALFNNVQARDTAEGASTITQQLARTLFLDQSPTVGRKLTEVILALQLEDYYHDKDKILELYINSVYYGRNAWGIAEAVTAYFPETKVAEINVSQCAFLAGLPQSPSYFAFNTGAAMDRQKAVVAKMKEMEFLGSDFVNSPPAIKQWKRPSPGNTR